MVLHPAFGFMTSLALRLTGNCLTRLQTASGKRDRSLGIAISTQAADDRHPFSQLIDDAVKSEDPDYRRATHCRRRR